MPRASDSKVTVLRFWISEDYIQFIDMWFRGFSASEQGNAPLHFLLAVPDLAGPGRSRGPHIRGTSRDILEQTSIYLLRVERGVWFELLVFSACVPVNLSVNSLASISLELVFLFQPRSSFTINTTAP